MQQKAIIMKCSSVIDYGSLSPEVTFPVDNVGLNQLLLITSVLSKLFEVFVHKTRKNKQKRS